MLKTAVFATRCQKEIIRDPLNLAFGIGFPIVVLLLLTAIQANVPVDLFPLQHITPGIAVFGLSFISLFSGMLIAKDRSTSFLSRLLASPLTASDFILGYTLPLLWIALAQSGICFVAAFALGLPVTVNVLLAIVTLIPTAVLFIAIGLLSGSLLNDKQVGGICGALLTNLSAWLSGTWFDLELVGGWFKTVGNALPFAHATEAARAGLVGDLGALLPHLWWVAGYAVAILALAIFTFSKKMHSDSI